jgi:hypothetical protein
LNAQQIAFPPPAFFKPHGLAEAAIIPAPEDQAMAVAFGNHTGDSAHTIRVCIAAGVND